MTRRSDRERFTARLRYALVVIAAVVCEWTAAGCVAQQTAAIASAHPLATAAGQSVLERGGNAFDAAVAVAAALAVVEPYSSGLGGGGFFLLHRAADGHQVMIDARETAPRGITEAHYVDPAGRPIAGATRRGGTAAAIPGMPAALAHLAERYARLPLATTLAPAIRLARDGFPVDIRYSRIVKLREAFLRSERNAAVFLANGSAPEPGHVLRQAALATTLERIARSGASGFYDGPVARALVDEVNRRGGAWSLGDLLSYNVVERAPLRFTYRGATVTSAPPPSAGGVALAQAMGMLEEHALERVGTSSTDHLIVEALRRAFRDRGRYLGDPDFAQVPVARLVSREYIRALGADIDPARATRSDALAGQARAGGSNTTHFSIVDTEGNRVAATLSINSIFGSGVIAASTGVVLNNEMDDFALNPDVANFYGLRSGAANLVAPGKRPLSGMTPTFVEDEKGVLVLGSAGGSRIASQVLLVALEYLRSPDVDLARLLALPRYHHQHLPDRVEIEPEGFPPEWRAAMEARGHSLATVRRLWGNMHVAFKSKRTGAASAATDPRGEGIAWY